MSTQIRWPGEPPLDELLSEQIFRLMMKRDRVEPARLRRQMKAAARRLARQTAAQLRRAAPPAKRH